MEKCLLVRRFSIDEIVFVALGFFATASCVAPVLGGRVISLFSLSILMAIALLIGGGGQSYSQFPFGRLFRLYGTWSIAGIVSSVFGIFFFLGEPEWTKAAIKDVPKILLYFFFVFLLMKSAKGYRYCELILSGLFYGIAINVFWAIADAVIFYLFDFSITNELFRSYILATDTRYEMLSLVLGDIIRSGGLNGDPANIGMFAPILASYGLYSKKYLWYILGVVGVFASISIVALASIAVISLIYMLSSIKSFVVGVICILILSVGYSFLSFDTEDVSFQMGDAVFERLEGKAESDTSDKENARAMYWLNFIPAVAMTPTTILVGTGYGTASHAYLRNGLVEHEDIPYDPEQTYFSTLFDIGLLGFMAFFLLHIGILKESFSRRLKSRMYLMLFAGLEGVLLSFAGYHYILYSVSTLFVVAGVVLLSSDTERSNAHE